MTKKKKITIGIIIMVVLLVIINSAKKDEQTSETTAAETSAARSAKATSSDAYKTDTLSCTVSARNPQLKKGSLFAGAQWNDPSVIKEGQEYIMYASAAKGMDGDIKIYRLTSADALSWKRSPESAVFEKSTTVGAWDAAHTETPSVVKFNGTYYLFYTAEPNLSPTSWSIGYATSLDGIHWDRKDKPLLKPTSPNTDPTLAFNQYVVAEPGAVVFNNKIYLYFTALGANINVGGTLETLGVITSSNGTDWSEPQVAVTPDQAQYPRNAGWIGYSTPSAVVIGGAIHLFFDVVNEKPSWKQQRIHHAVSSNGISGWTQDAQPIFKREDFAWTKEEIRAPSALFENGKIKLWFAGHDVDGGSASLAIGMAECALGN